ncbi:hypothetical protein D1007_25099 [Hordeum vulgare]|nr:hypothetical protein D1007_25099 [Hordeum vulgare]
MPAHRDNVVRLGAITVDGVSFTNKSWHEDDHGVSQDFLLHVRVAIEKMPMQMWSIKGATKVLGDSASPTASTLTHTRERDHTRAFACWVWVWDAVFIPTTHTIWRMAWGAERVEAVRGFSPPSTEVAPPP